MKENFVLDYFGRNKLCSELQLFISRRFTPLILGVLLILSFSQKAIAQVHTCGFDQCLNSVANGNFIQNFQEQIQIQMGLSSLPNSGDPTPIIEIPVIVHVIHSGEEIGTLGGNIHNDQITAAINNLNADFNGSGIQFCKARRDELGNPLIERGVLRVNGTSIGYDGTMTMGGANEASIKALSYLPNYSYLNIWIVSTIIGGNGTTAGFAYLPSTASNNLDGIVMDKDFFGTSGYRVLTHEVGHYLGLFHTFQGDDYDQDGDVDGCPPLGLALGDGIGDTDAHQRSPSFTCLSGLNPCYPVGSPNLLENIVHNHMDYSDESCRNNFSQEQKNWMITTINLHRAGLIESLGCTDGCTPTFPITLEQFPLNPLQINQSVLLVGSAPIGSHNFQWYLDGRPIANANLNNIEQSFSNPGFYNICFRATNNMCTLESCLEVLVLPSSNILCASTELEECELILNRDFRDNTLGDLSSGYEFSLMFQEFDRICNWVDFQGTPNLRELPADNLFFLIDCREMNTDVISTTLPINLISGQSYILAFDYVALDGTDIAAPLPEEIQINISNWGDQNSQTVTNLITLPNAQHPVIQSIPLIGWDANINSNSFSHVEHTFTFTGSNSQFLSVRGSAPPQFQSVFSIKNISIKQCCVPEPTIQVAVDPNNPCRYTFNGINTGDAGIMVWDIENGPLIGNQTEITHTFPTPGRYNICLQITCEGNAVEECVEVNATACNTPCSDAVNVNTITAIQFCGSNTYTISGSIPLPNGFVPCRAGMLQFIQEDVIFSNYSIIENNSQKILSFSATTTSVPSGGYNIILCGPNGQTICETFVVQTLSSCDICSEITVPVIATCNDNTTGDGVNTYTGIINIPGLSGLLDCGSTATIGGFRTGPPTSNSNGTSIPFVINTNTNQPFETTVNICLTNGTDRFCYRVVVQVINPCNSNCEIQPTFDLSCEEVQGTNAVFNFEHIYFDPTNIKFDDYRLCDNNDAIVLGNSNGQVTINNIRDLPNSGGIFTDIDLSIPCKDVRNLGFTTLTYTLCDSQGNEYCVEFTLNLACPDCPSNKTEGRNISLDEVNIYPNPVSDIIMVDNIVSNGNASYTIQDIIGQKVKMGNLSNGINEIDVSNLNGGMYRIRIESQNNFIDKRIIIIK